ncbi:PREDICTED: PIH1 domain-containing protein 1-like [Priapulus caudatus]|uniref:PIH1 domain-containing protein 1 n=1 Tax=Priapulus caudatus TaxID=37621 RepID=A0ABM1DVE3_PRICU|nr:PREDICTED: PIH1 domain-containing protein 1-like [Priapulus caudatus]
MAATDKSLLTFEDKNSDLLKNLVIEAAKPGTDSGIAERQFALISPEPGFCIKTKKSNGEKVFINICQSTHIPPPIDLTDEELLAIVNDEDPSSYNVPMSLGEPHTESDNSGNHCTAYDVIISNTFYDKVETNQLFYNFMISLALEGLEEKYSLSLSREVTRLKNKMFFGVMPDQVTRTKAKPTISEIPRLKNPTTKQDLKAPQAPNQTIEPQWKEPSYQFIQDPIEGYPEFLIGEIQLPGMKSVKDVELDIGEDRILLHALAQRYKLDVFMPFLMASSETGAQFNRITQVLTITIPVQPENKA